MRRPGLYLLCILALLVFSGCARRARIIPRDKLADIYVDMFLADEWLKDHPSARRTADTTFFYEPVFRKHGYRFADYDASLSHYLRDPARFSKILTAASEKLKKRAKILQKEEDLDEALRAFEKRLEGYVRRDFQLEGILRDSLSLWPAADSLPVVDTFVHLLVLPAPADSSAAPADSAAAYSDSLSAPLPEQPESVVKPVSVRKLSSAAAKPAEPLPLPKQRALPVRRPSSDRQ